MKPQLLPPNVLDHFYAGGPREPSPVLRRDRPVAVEPLGELIGDKLQGCGHRYRSADCPDGGNCRAEKAPEPSVNQPWHRRCNSHQQVFRSLSF